MCEVVDFGMECFGIWVQDKVPCNEIMTHWCNMFQELRMYEWRFEV